jgi:cellulose synthase/poly-beta-1,6-N-acetylglucosamine synthase-like glycosyltransferase
MNFISSILLCIVFIPSAYWLILAIAAIRPQRKPEVVEFEAHNRFAIVVPAHNEENVIEKTVSKLLEQSYPRELFSVFVVADYCTDSTTQMAKKKGAIVLERNSGPRTGKGSALSWAFGQISAIEQFDAMVIFDADTKVDANFLRIVDARLIKGDQVIQGQHIISNPNSGWFPALTWAMFLIDNRFQNLGRSNLGWSAKHMGDSICFRTEILRKLGWGEGLTEDYNLRQRLILEGVRIVYEPNAIGYGEAVLSWKTARTQRARWLRGVKDANQQSVRQLFFAALRQKDGVLLDGFLQAVVPSYSTLTLFSAFLLFLHILIHVFIQPVFDLSLLLCWSGLVGLLAVYPLLGLALERAPLRAYIAIMLGPLFILWRTWLTLSIRFRNKNIIWVRTNHQGSQ